MKGTVCSNGSLRMSLSIYIPHVFLNITRDRIADAFASNGYGVVERIDFVAKMSTNGQTYNGAFVHFSHWYSSETADRFREKIEDPLKQARIVYDDPWYWIVLPNTGKKVDPGARKECLNTGEAPQNINLVDAGYAACLEREIYSLRDENARLREIIRYQLGMLNLGEMSPHNPICY